MRRSPALVSNRRPARRVVALLVAALLLPVARPAPADTFAVGSFTKNTSAAPVTQSVAHGLGETPKALILWTNSKTSETLGAGARFAFGVSDGTTSKSAGAESDDNVFTAVAGRRIANKALTIVDQAGTVRAEADLQSVDATDFTLNWTTNNATAYVIHFVAIGGAHVSAKVIGWTLATSTGNQAVTGVGFKPDVVLHAHVGSGFTSSPPATDTNAAFGLSVMDADGNQWANTLLSVDGAGFSDTQRYQRTNKCLVGISNDLSTSKEATFVSMDSDGFTINYSTASASASQAFSLALKGVQARAGTFTKATGGAPASQAVTGVPFRPRLLLLASAQDTARTVAVDHSRFGLGASDGTTEASIALQDTDGLDITSVDGVDKTSKVFVKVNNNTPTIDAEADTTSLDAAGFTLNWTTNDAVATEMLYLVLAPRRRIQTIE